MTEDIPSAFGQYPAIPERLYQSYRSRNEQDDWIKQNTTYGYPTEFIL